MGNSYSLARGDVPIHVLLSFTSYEEERESDFFSAGDVLLRDERVLSGELGACHINSTELSSGLFYNYVVVDIPLLVSNLQGVERSDWYKVDKSLTAEVVKRLIQLIATVSPGAKLGRSEERRVGKE